MDRVPIALGEKRREKKKEKEKENEKKRKEKEQVGKCSSCSDWIYHS